MPTKYNIYLPQGSNAALLPGIEYNIAGLFIWTDTILQVKKIIEDKFAYNLPIKYIYGSPQIRWNSGRIIVKSKKDFCNKKTEDEIKKIISHNIIPLFTFTNSELDKDDLLDSNCNNLLSLVNDYRGHVITANNLLENYIREKYKDIKIHASVITAAKNKQRTFNFYNELSYRYYQYVVHPDDNFNYELLKQIHKSNAEILINERCYFACKQRYEHYQSIAREQLEQANGKYRSEQFLNSCAAIPETKQVSSKIRNISLSISELENLSSLGFKRFKIQGRTDNIAIFLFDLLRYTLDNNIAFPTAYIILCQYIEKNLLK